MEASRIIAITATLLPNFSTGLMVCRPSNFGYTTLGTNVLQTESFLLTTVRMRLTFDPARNVWLLSIEMRFLTIRFCG